MKLESLPRGELVLLKAKLEGDQASLSSKIDNLLRRRKQMRESAFDMSKIIDVLTLEITHALEDYGDLERQISLLERLLCLKDSSSLKISLSEVETALLSDAVKRAQMDDLLSLNLGLDSTAV